MGGDGESKDEELNCAFYQVGKQVGNSCLRVCNTLHYYIPQCQILPFNLKSILKVMGETELSISEEKYFSKWKVKLKKKLQKEILSY